MSNRSVMLTFAGMNAIFVVLNMIAAMSGSLLALLVAGFNLYCAKVCWDAAKRPPNR